MSDDNCNKIADPFFDTVYIFCYIFLSSKVSVFKYPKKMRGRFNEKVQSGEA